MKIYAINVSYESYEDGLYDGTIIGYYATLELAKEALIDISLADVLEKYTYDMPDELNGYEFRDRTDKHTELPKYLFQYKYFTTYRFGEYINEELSHVEDYHGTYCEISIVPIEVVE